jgi:hypothetical protein
MLGDEEVSRINVTSTILLVSAAMMFAGGLFLPWYSIELGVFERMTGTVGAAYRMPTVMLGALTFALGLLLRTDLGPRLWRLPMAATVAGSALAVAIFDVTLVIAHHDDLTFGGGRAPAVVRIGAGLWVVLIGAAMQCATGLLTWGLERTPQIDRRVRA